MTDYSTDISVSARYSELSGLLATMTKHAASLGVADAEALRLQLVVEELFMNTINHGHQGETEHKVGIALFRNDNVLTLRYEDNAPPFDTSAIRTGNAAPDTLGGLGLGLIHGMGKSLCYRRIDQCNVTEIAF